MTGIITTFSQELDALKDYSLVEDIKRAGGQRFYIGHLNEQDIVFVLAHNDPLDAALAAQMMIDTFHVKQVIFTSQAFPLAPYIAGGDLIIGNYHIRPAKYDEAERQMLEGDPTLLQTLRTVCDIPRADRPPHIFGTLIDWRVADFDHPRLRMMQQEFGAIAIDSVGAALAHTCHLNETPFAAICITVPSPESAEPVSEDRINRACQGAFELKGLALVELTVSAITAHL
ncbi:hypothetical protein TRIP_C21411 [Candidatus Zixiibacteriota bacterium]|nr:hypothetical protein TRIP_C21411 [candidate division Zixibacteria bacterium]